MGKSQRFYPLFLLFLSAAIVNPSTASHSTQTNTALHISTALPALQCPPPGPADFSNQTIVASSSSASIPGHVVQPVEQSLVSLIGPLNPTLQLQLRLVFKIRNETQFQNCLASINDPSSPEYGRYLNSTTLQAFLPTPGQKASVSNLLSGEGLTVTDGASPLVLNVEGSAEAIMSAFAISLSVYIYGNTTFFATDSDPQMPSNLASLVNGILGLENYTRVMPDESPCTGPYCPQGIQIGYSISTLTSSGDTGSGEKVAIVDQPGDQNAQTDINTFDTQYGLPATTLDIIYPDGPKVWDPGWATESAMDIEAVHSVAPGATIVLAYDTDTMNAVDYVTKNGLAKVISNSWHISCGFPLGDCSDTQLPQDLVSSDDITLAADAAQGVTILFSSGDQGWKPDGFTIGTAFPASDPNVLAVGATNLVLSGCGITTCTGYGSESGAAISGGGYSEYFSEPSWQTKAIGSTGSKCTLGSRNPTCRGVPDVSMFGFSPDFWVYSTVNGWGGQAGTSLATPLWAGLIAIALQVKGGGPFGNIAPLLYSLAAGPSYPTLFHDITMGSNPGYPVPNEPGYSAGIGWDPVTGWGSPIANNLVNALSGKQILITGVDAGQGSVNPKCPGPGGCSEAVRSSVTVTTTPSAGWQFSSWSTQTGQACPSNPCTFSMPNNAVTLRATFTVIPPSMQLLTTGVDSGQGSVSPSCTGGCGETIGSSQTVTATPSSGWQFSSWSTQTGVSCSTNSCTFTMPSVEVMLGATFTPIQTQLQILITGVDAGEGSVSPNCPSPSGCPEGVGSSVTVTATAGSGWQFSSWSTQTGITCLSNPCTFNMPNNAVTLRATFAPIQTQTVPLPVVLLLTVVLPVMLLLTVVLLLQLHRPRFR
jgi:kumamolisin